MNLREVRIPKVAAKERRKLRIIALVIGIMIGFLFSEISKAAEVDEDLKEAVINYYKKASNPESVTYKSWKEGLKKQHLFELQKIETKVEFLDQDVKEDHIGVGILLTITAYVMNYSNAKKRVSSSRGVLVLINRETRQVMGGMTVISSPMKVREGWNEETEI